MKRLLAATMVALLLTGAYSTPAAETRVGGQLYAYWKLDLSEDGDNFNEFALGRAYVTVRSELSQFTSVRLTTDLRETDGFDGYSVVMKYAYLDWKPGFGRGIAVLRFGLQPTLYIDNMNKLWGRRYLEKTVGDLRGFLTTSDLGAGLVINLDRKARIGYIAGNIWNGTSYTDIEEMNKNKDFSGSVYLSPFRENDDFTRTVLLGQAYIGTRNLVFDDTFVASDYRRTLFSFGGLLAYRDILDLGADVNMYSEGQGAGVDELKRTGYSVFGAVYLQDLMAGNSPLRTLNLFGRADLYDPNTDEDNDGNTLIIAGVECVPVKGFRASVNIRTVSYQDEEEQSETYLYVNTLFAF